MTQKTTTGWLDTILAQKRIEIEKLHESWDSDFTVRRVPLEVSESLARPIGAPLHLVCEVKMKSPSAGELSTKLTPDARALAYVKGGASMVSVLVDEKFFGGCWGDLERVRMALDGQRREVPLLAKEFVLDEVQLSVARAKGADAVLLIARIVTADRLIELARAAARSGLTPLVEIASEAELEVALSTKAKMIGVNARDLDSLAIDPARATRLIAAIPRDRIAVHLSGVRTEADVKALARGRADAVLLGEVLMREDAPESLVARFVNAAFG
ncbi:MAG: Indole-3-glycerol phosphate synthase [Myxococcaceae bacterium]|nr:Indole-3-glycerol phosphate synthase [Myxococcaceae bacterium]